MPPYAFSTWLTWSSSEHGGLGIIGFLREWLVSKEYKGRSCQPFLRLMLGTGKVSLLPHYIDQSKEKTVPDSRRGKIESRSGWESPEAEESWPSLETTLCIDLYFLKYLETPVL